MASRQGVARQRILSKKAGRRVSKQSFSKIPERQLALPAGFSADGKKFVPLRDVISPSKPTMQLTQLTPDQQARLTAERIRRQHSFQLGMVGVGVVNKARAIAEVESQSDVGRTLIEIEGRALRMLIEQAKHGPAKKRGGRRPR